MHQIRRSRNARRMLALLLVTPLLVLSACAENPAGVEVEGDRYLEEIFDITARNNVQYGAAVDATGIERALLLDLYQPTEDAPPLRPAVIWLHGGSFQDGTKTRMIDFARSSARRGFVSASANYRLRENAVFDYTNPNDSVGEAAKRDAQHDIKAAVRWIRANADELRVDPHLIFLVGYSAGGTAALRAAASPDDPGASGNPGHPSSLAGVVAISTIIEAGVLPAVVGRTLRIHGTHDTKVPFAEVQAACAAVSQCELVAVDGGDHNMLTPARDQIISETARFLHAQVVP